GGLGKIFAEFLAREYRARLVLCGRSMLRDSDRQLFNDWEKLGAQIEYVSIDLAQTAAAQTLVARARQRFGKIDGILHAAGVTQDGLTRNQDWADFQSVLAPKVQGLVALDQATAGEALDWFVVFSSSASLLGNIGQSNYAYANAFMDEYVQLRERRRHAGHCYGKS